MEQSRLEADISLDINASLECNERYRLRLAWLSLLSTKVLYFLYYLLSK